MKGKLKWTGRAAVLLLAAPMLPALPQEAPGGALLSHQELLQTTLRAQELMGGVSVAIPVLSRAGAPLAENLRQAYSNLQRDPDRLEFNYTAMTTVRAFVLLVDSLPKPVPFPEEAQRQLTELRDVLNRLETHFGALLEATDQTLRTPDPDELNRYADANRKLLPPKAGQPRVVFLGDSITDAWRLNEYFPDRDFVNRGIGGQTTDQMLGRFKEDVLDLTPSAVVILAGTNDLGRGTSVGAIENNLQMMAELAELHKIKVILCSVLPVDDYHKDQNLAFLQTARPPALIRALDDWLKTYCALKHFAYVNYYSHMLDASGMLKAEMTDDGLHPNSVGYRIMGPLALEAIDKTAAPPAQQKTKKRRLLPWKDN